MLHNVFVLSPAVLWLLSGIGLLLIELAVPGLFFFVSFAFGCLFGAFAALLGATLAAQCGLALVVSLIQFRSMRRVLKRYSETTTTPTNVHALVGQRAQVVKKIIAGQTGSVKIGSEVWPARSVDGDIAVEATVQVVRIEGNHAIVKAIRVKG